jgi:hypothetical protein
MFTGCKKELEFTFKGKVTNRQTGEVIPNLLVNVFQDEGTFNSSYKLIGSGTTNSSGEYEIVVPREQVNGVKVQTSDDEFHKEYKVVSFDDLSTEDDNTVHLETAYRSWVKISFVNPDEEANSIYYNKTDGNTQCEECCLNESTYYSGITNDYQICGADGGTYFYYNIVVPGVSVTLDSLLCLPLDTTYKTINF